MMGPVIFLVLLLGVAALMYYRNEWVFKQSTAHIEAAYAFVIKKAATGEHIEGKPYYHCIAPYNTMLYKFWLWNLSDFTTDREKFDEVYSK